MVVLNKIYTRTGDKGSTALGSGDRVPKHHARIDAYGTVDETNAIIGMARAELESADKVVDEMLGRIQNDLFDLGADLCVPEQDGEEAGKALRVAESQVERLEREIDQLNGELETLRSFVLPGGKRAAATLHSARTVCRRAERLVVALSEQENETVSQAALRYINRLSDFLFVASRYVNDKGKRDVLWVPGENR